MKKTIFAYVLGIYTATTVMILDEDRPWEEKDGLLMTVVYLCWPGAAILLWIRDRWE